MAGFTELYVRIEGRVTEDALEHINNLITANTELADMFKIAANSITLEDIEEDIANKVEIASFSIDDNEEDYGEY